MKSRSDSDEGISERVWVACHSKCNIPSKSHRESLRDPASAKKPRASASLFAPQKFDFAQDDRLIYYFAVVQVKSILYSFLFYHKSPSFSTPFINFLRCGIDYIEE